MLNDKSLEERLNAVKNGGPLPEPPKKHHINKQVKSESEFKISNKKKHILNIGFKTLDTLLASFLYGYAFNTIFSLEWSIVGCIAVGFLFNHLLAIVKSLFSNKFK